MIYIWNRKEIKKKGYVVQFLSMCYLNGIDKKFKKCYNNKIYNMKLK